MSDPSRPLADGPDIIADMLDPSLLVPELLDNPVLVNPILGTIGTPANGGAGFLDVGAAPIDDDGPVDCEAVTGPPCTPAPPETPDTTPPDTPTPTVEEP